MDRQALIDLLPVLDVPIPRYTSYPTANRWESRDAEAYRSALSRILPDEPLSLYVHIPFCHSMCLYCACSVVLNRNPEQEERYVEALLREIEMTAACLPHKRPVLQLHFGGGTPTKISSALLKKVMNALREAFVFDKDAEIAIEIDPRSVSADDFAKLADLCGMGFNRVSFGVQDTNPDVQEAVRRRQDLSLIQGAMERSRSLGVPYANIDLIYGLPLQTPSTFRDTIEIVGGSLRPNRIALFSYAKVPWIKPHQKAIRDEWLPSRDEKFCMYLNARQRLIELGYAAIGMDHFALKNDPICLRAEAKCLRRNFQGYTVLDCTTMLGFGMSSISDLPSGYFQNAKELSVYYDRIGQNLFATDRGVCTTHDDRLRRWIIGEIMCHCALDMDDVSRRWDIDFRTYFAPELEALTWYEAHGLLQLLPTRLQATSAGELFLRNIASCFDIGYRTHSPKTACFSRAI